jgi:hypothetical protein
MSLKNNFLYFILIMALSACHSSPEIPENKVLEKQMYGEWRNSSLRLLMNSYNNTEETKEFIVKEGEWEQKMKIQPIRTFYRADGTYNSEHRSLNDSLIYNPAGRWVILDDTLIMRDTFPEPGLSYRYKLVVKGGQAEFTGIEDCDRDGKADDNYFGIQRRQK